MDEETETVQVNGREVTLGIIMEWLTTLKVRSKGRFYDMDDGRQREMLATEMLADMKSLGEYVETLEGAA